MRSTVYCLIALAILSACAKPADFQQFEGQKLSDLIERSGVPQGQRTIAGLSVYTWESWRAIDGTTYQCRFEATTKAGSDAIIKTNVVGNIGGCNALANQMNL